ncbi:MAG: Crp/Fnr family transcriptional regulator [Bacteroidota bacterium]|nr:Crp/Fnr family transcriptional regulator [Bacteroidota bacterium]
MKKEDNIPYCKTCFKDFDTVFKKLTDEELSILHKNKIYLKNKRGASIYNEGDNINGIYCVSDGILKIFKTGIDGREQIIAFAKKGDIIGYRSILSKERACSTAKVISDAQLCFIPINSFLSFIKNNSDFAIAVMNKTCKELGEANSYITDIAQKTVRERLAEILLKLEINFGTDADKILQITLTREELANIVGTATESVIRLLSEFKKDKIINLEGRKIIILEKQKLTNISNSFY